MSSTRARLAALCPRRWELAAWTGRAWQAARARAFHRHATHDGREAVEGRRGGGCEFFFFSNSKTVEEEEASCWFDDGCCSRPVFNLLNLYMNTYTG